MTLPTFQTYRETLDLGGHPIQLRGLSLSDIELIAESRPTLFADIAESIESSDGTDSGAMIQLVTKFSDLAALVVAICAEGDDIESDSATVRLWPVGYLSAAAMKVFELSTRGNAAAGKFLMSLLPAASPEAH